MKNLWVPLSGAIAQQRKVETIANNVANANTPGFKKDRVVFKEYLTALEKGAQDLHMPRKEWQPKDFYHTHGAQNAMVKVAGSFTDHSQGQLSPTNNPFDLALHGPGFFEIQTPNGLRYTRRGTFSLDQSGFLVNNQGFRVLRRLDPATLNNNQGQNAGADGAPQPNQRFIQINPNQPFSVDLAGRVVSNGENIAQVSIVEFGDLATLKKEGKGNYINSDNNNILASQPKTSVRQGFVEDSNINVVEEMSELIKANRHFESIQRAIKAYDNITGRAVNDISKF